ncbi:C-X-C chemokine receptor type 3.3 isoform X2 [Puntigrus tetrazona]|nr:C-X-C chemokine receptor type 3.3 isoform X2 [Puntigrus tetrazona]
MQVELHGLFDDNTTFDYDSYEYNEEICPSSRVSDALAVFIPLLYSVCFFCGLLGNGLVIMILWLKRLNLSVMDIFILLLSLWDTLLLLTLPLWAVDAVKGWVVGTEFCKLSGALFKINFYGGILTLACFSVEYCLSVVCGVQLLSHKRPVVVYCCCAIICVLCLLLSVPDWIFLSVSSDHGKQECMHRYPPESWRLASRLPYLFVSLGLVLLFFCSMVLLNSRHNSKCREKKKGQSTAIVASLVLVFFVCWTPYSISFMVNTFRPTDSVSAAVAEDCVVRQWTSSKITAVFGLLHCVVNPVIYLCLSKEFQRRVLTLMRFSACNMENKDVSLWDSSGVKGAVQEEQGSLQPMNEIKQTIKAQDFDI